MKNKRGISLIVLVISIIVMIILAAVVIITVSNQNIIKKSKKAKFMEEYSLLQEALSIKVSEMYLSNSDLTTKEIDQITIQELNNELTDSEAAKFVVQNGKIVLTDNATTEEKSWILGSEEELENSVSLNIAYGNTAPSDTKKLWVKTSQVKKVEVTKVNTYLSGLTRINDINATLNTGVLGAGCEKVGNKIYILAGGPDAYSSYTNIIQIYDIDRDVVTVSDTVVPKSLFYTTSVVKNSDIYLFGGKDTTESSSIYKYDTVKDEISEVANMPGTAYAASAEIVGDIVYIIGGLPNGQIYKYNTVTNDISTVTTASLGNNGYSITTEVVGNKIYMFGDGGNSRQVRIFDTTNETIQSLGDILPTGFQVAKAIYNDGYVYIFGGYISYSNLLNSILSFNISDNLITTLKVTLQYPSYGLAGAVDGKNIYIIGGGSAGNSYNTIQKFQVSDKNLENKTLKIIEKTSGMQFNLVDNLKIKISCIPSIVYVGDENNKAKEVEAYLYKNGSWQNIK